jgi:hypothetical protein
MHPKRGGYALPQIIAERPVLSPDEVRKLISELPSKDKGKLFTIAEVLAGTRALDADDLYQEALRRALAGTRRCPRDVDIMPFFVQTMRSVAAQWIKARRDHIEEPVDETTGDDSPSAEEQMIFEELQTQVLDLFKDEPILLKVLKGMKDGERGQDLENLCGLDKKALGYARKIIRSRIISFLRKGR